MRTTWILAFLVLYPGSALAEIVDIEFQSVRHRDFRTTSLTADLNKHWGIGPDKAKVLLVETPYLSGPQYETQYDYLLKLEDKAEKYQVMMVVACQDEEFEAGFHTTIATAMNLSGGELVFRIRLLDSKGAVLKESDQPVSDKTLIEWLED